MILASFFSKCCKRVNCCHDKQDNGHHVQACVWCEEVQLMERERFRRTQDSLDPDPLQMASKVRRGALIRLNKAY